MGPDDLRAVRQTDRLLGQILTTISARPALRAHTMVILTADHGGDGGSHSKASKLANYRVPFMVWGPGGRRRPQPVHPQHRQPQPRLQAHQLQRPAADSQR